MVNVGLRCSLSLSLSLAARYIFHVVDRWIYRFDVFLITRKHFRLIFLATITIHLSITSISCFRFAFKLKFLAFYGEAYNRIFNFSRDFELVDIASSFQNIKNNKIRATDACLVWKGSWSSALVSFSHRSCFISREDRGNDASQFGEQSAWKSERKISPSIRIDKKI